MPSQAPRSHSPARKPVDACSAPLLQRAPLTQFSKVSQAEQAPPIVHAVLQSVGQPLGSSHRAQLELHFGHDFSHVRLHLDYQAARSGAAPWMRTLIPWEGTLFLARASSRRIPQRGGVCWLTSLPT